MCSIGAGGGGLCDCKGKYQRGGETRIFNRVASRVRFLESGELKPPYQICIQIAICNLKKLLEENI